MSRCHFTLQASCDLDGIYDYIALDNPIAAASWVGLLKKKCRALARNPGIGRRREDLLPMLRSFPVGSYVIFYRSSPTGIEVIRVLHGARDIQSEFR